MGAYDIPQIVTTLQTYMNMNEIAKNKTTTKKKKTGLLGYERYKISAYYHGEILWN